MAKIFKLPNGVTCVSEERPQTGKVSMQIHIKSGSLHESAEENGLTFLAQESCNGGTATRSREQIAEDIESKGGSLSTSTSRGSTIFSVSALTRHAEETFAILADVIRNPAFDAAEIQKTKTQIGQWISQQEESPATKANLKFYESAFTGQPFGSNPMGSQELLSSFTPEQVRKKYAELLAHPENIIISFSGDITTAQAEKLAGDYFGDLAGTTPATTPLMTFTGGDFREANNNDQLNIQFGFPAPHKDHPDRHAALMLEEFLSGGMSSPLFQEIREKRGLVYSVGARYAKTTTSGFFNIAAGTGKGNAGQLVSVSLDLLGTVIRDGVDQKSLDQARERIIRSNKNSYETSSGASACQAGHIIAYGRLIPLDETEEYLKQVTSDDIRRVCAEMLREGKYALSAVGPQDTLPSAQEIKDMMQKQLQGVTLPAAKPVAASIKTQLTQAAKKEEAPNTEPKITVLKNGMMVVTVERPGTLACGAWVGAGSSHETPALNGATHMNEHMMFKGTPSYGPGQIDRLVEGELGGHLNAYTSRDKTAYYFYSLKADALEKVIDICGEMVFQANLDHEEYNGKNGGKGERDVVIEEIRRANDDINSRKWDKLFETAYPDQEHGRPILGTETTLRAITVQQLAAYRDEFYAPNNVVFSATGPIKHEDFVALIERKYGHMPAKNCPPLPAPSYQGGTAFIEMESARLCNVALTAESVSSTDPDNKAYEILGMILGNGASSRLNREIVINQELTAGVGAGNSDYRNGGLFLVVASVQTEKVKPFIDAVYAEIRKLAGDLTPGELDKAKAALEMNLLSDLETNRSACDQHGCNTLAYGRLVTPAEISAQIQKLTVDDIKRVAGKVLASNPTLAMVVPKGTNPGHLPKHEEVIALRDGKGPQNGSPRPDGPVV